MRYGVLASGSKGNATIIEHEGAYLLLDCGTTKAYLLEAFSRLNLTFDDIDMVLITHDHSDHTRQLKHFAHKPIYIPAIFENAHQIQAYQAFEVSPFKILPIQTSHDVKASVGYIIEAAGQKLVYITDTGYVREADVALIQGADYYILESNHDPVLLMKTRRPYQIKQRILSDTGHLSNEAAATLLTKVVTAQTKEVVLAHISLEANTEDLAYETSRKALTDETIKIQVAKQFEITLGGKL